MVGKKVNLKNNYFLSQYSFIENYQKECPVMFNIFKKLTQKDVEREIEEVQKIKLPLELQEWVKKYCKIGGKRDKKVWFFTYKVIKEISSIIPSVRCCKKYNDSLDKVKFLFTMFIILIDDIADEGENGELLKKIVNSSFAKKQVIPKNLSKLSLFALNIFRHINKEIKKYPAYESFNEILYFEIAQIFNSMRFANLVNEHLFLINKVEYWNYFPCTMQVISYNIIELMSSKKKFKDNDLKRNRDFLLIVQKMARIGNCISTWEKELYDRDFTSLVFAYALEYNVISIYDLKNGDVKKNIKIIKKSNIEKELMEEWNNYYQKIFCNVKKWKSTDMKKMSKKIEKLLILQLIFKC